MNKLILWALAAVAGVFVLAACEGVKPGAWSDTYRDGEPTPGAGPEAGPDQSVTISSGPEHGDDGDETTRYNLCRGAFDPDEEAAGLEWYLDDDESKRLFVSRKGSVGTISYEGGDDSFSIPVENCFSKPGDQTEWQLTPDPYKGGSNPYTNVPGEVTTAEQWFEKEGKRYRVTRDTSPGKEMLTVDREVYDGAAKKWVKQTTLRFIHHQRRDS